jgi:hypothetical protein
VLGGVTNDAPLGAASAPRRRRRQFTAFYRRKRRRKGCRGSCIKFLHVRLLSSSESTVRLSQTNLLKRILWPRERRIHRRAMPGIADTPKGRATAFCFWMRSASCPVSTGEAAAPFGGASVHPCRRRNGHQGVRPHYVRTNTHLERAVSEGRFRRDLYTEST